ncbi:MAG: helix-turn-helix transcriptional regulator [Clostridia bacterium]|nr:helix-turn-helix transcriptional regulator [Clostridia bacterium]
MDDLSKIKNYISLLKNEHKLCVSIHVEEDDRFTNESINTLVKPLCDSLGLIFLNQKIDDDSSDLVDIVKKYIKENRSTNITSEHICKYIGCSRSLISHQFKNRTGMSIREYLKNLRLEDARQLLERSKLTITEIAFAVGFGSSNYFTNVFKQEFGISPGAYRKLYHSNLL